MNEDIEDIKVATFTLDDKTTAIKVFVLTHMGSGLVQPLTEKQIKELNILDISTFNGKIDDLIAAIKELQYTIALDTRPQETLETY